MLIVPVFGKFNGNSDNFKIMKLETVTEDKQNAKHTAQPFFMLKKRIL